MRSPVKVLLISAAAICILFGVVLLVANVYIGSSGFRSRIQSAVEKATGLRPEIRKAGYSPWGGLALKDISLQPGPPNPDTASFQAGRFRAKFRLLPLLANRVVVTDLVLENPELTLESSESGEIVVPLPPLPAPSASTDPSKEKGPTKAAEERKEPARTTELGRFKLRRGRIVIRDAKKRETLLLEKIRLTGNLGDLTSIPGTIRIGEATLPGIVVVGDAGSSFAYSNTGFLLPDVTASIAGGALTGEFDLNTNPTGFDYGGSFEFEGVDLGRLIAEAGGPEGAASGRLQGTLELHGADDEPVQGKGQARLLDGEVRGYPLFSELGEILKIKELQRLRFEEGNIDYTFSDKTVFVQSMVLRSDSLSLKARGKVENGGELDFDAELHMNKKLRSRLPDLMKSNFQDAEDPDYKYVTFRVTGDLEDPKTDLLERVGLKQLEKHGRQILDAFKNIFGKPSKKE